MKRSDKPGIAFTIFVAVAIFLVGGTIIYNIDIGDEWVNSARAKASSEKEIIYTHAKGTAVAYEIKSKIEFLASELGLPKEDVSLKRVDFLTSLKFDTKGERSKRDKLVYLLKREKIIKSFLSDRIPHTGGEGIVFLDKGYEEWTMPWWETRVFPNRAKKWIGIGPVQTDSFPHFVTISFEKNPNSKERAVEIRINGGVFKFVQEGLGPK